MRNVSLFTGFRMDIAFQRRQCCTHRVAEIKQHAVSLVIVGTARQKYGGEVRVKPMPVANNAVKTNHEWVERAGYELDLAKNLLQLALDGKSVQNREVSMLPQVCARTNCAVVRQRPVARESRDCNWQKTSQVDASVCPMARKVMRA